MDFKDILKGIAPTIASALLGPLGGVAVAAIGNIIGVDEPTQDKIADAFKKQQLTGEMVAELKKLELQYQESEKERGFKYSELEFKDTESARNMQIATKSTTPTILTYMVTVGFFGILLALMFGTVEKTDPLLVMLGSLGTAWTACVSFWFGSTHGSQQKSQLLANK
jgi:hypothetical protein